MSLVNSDMESSQSQQLDERLLELTALFEISQSLTSSLSLQAILENLLRIPMGHMLISRGLVLLKKEMDGEFTIEGVKGLSRNFIGKSLRIDNPPGHTTFFQEFDGTDDWKAFFKEFEIHLLLPLNSSQGIIGILGFGDKIGGKPFTESEVEFLNSLSNIASSAVSNGLMVDQIQQVNRQLDRKVQQLNTIFDISRELNSTLDQYKIANLLSFAIMGELLVNKCVIYFKEQKQMTMLLNKGIKSELKNDDALLGLSEPVLLEESSNFKEFYNSGLALLVPMRMHEETCGVIGIGPKINPAPFAESDLEFLKTLGNQAVTSLENARLFQETLEKQRMEEELNLARNIQRGLLPNELPLLSGFDIAAMNVSSKEVGGDYYDIIPLSDTEFGITIADVSGKGAGAALLMSNLQASLHALKPSRENLSQMIAQINDLIHRNTDLDKFITFFYGILDITTHEFVYCNAGHNPPILIRANHQVEELSTGGLVLGMMPNVIYETGSVQMNRFDVLSMFTDGITETIDIEDEEFGEQRLVEVLLKNTNASAKNILDAIIDQTNQFKGDMPQYDDMTMILMKSIE